MISFLTCSIDEQLLDRLRANLAGSVGVEHEFLVHRNRELGWGLARAYNALAGRARHPLVCFLHEDVAFRSPPGWGERIVRFFAENPGAGVVGFAGCQVKSRTPSGWFGPRTYNRQDFVQHSRSGRTRQMRNDPAGEPFSRVMVLDGMCLFVPRDAWAESPFDEATFPAFHGYDLDFTTQVGMRRTNHVCHTVRMEHFSPGTFDRRWRVAVAAYHRKWADALPLSCVPLDERQRDAIEATVSYRFLRDLLDARDAEPSEIAAARALHRPHRTVERSARLLWRSLRRAFR